MHDIERVKLLLEGALQQEEGPAREAWLRSHCAASDALFHEVSTLATAYLTAQRQPLPPPAPWPVPAADFGPYRAESLLGRGGTSAVYRARRTEVPPDVALKVMPALTSGPEFLR